MVHNIPYRSEIKHPFFDYEVHIFGYISKNFGMARVIIVSAKIIHSAGQGAYFRVISNVGAYFRGVLNFGTVR